MLSAALPRRASSSPEAYPGTCASAGLASSTRTWTRSRKAAHAYHWPLRRVGLGAASGSVVHRPWRWRPGPRYAPQMPADRSSTGPTHPPRRCSQCGTALPAHHTGTRSPYLRCSAGPAPAGPGSEPLAPSRSREMPPSCRRGWYTTRALLWPSRSGWRYCLRSNQVLPATRSPARQESSGLRCRLQEPPRSGAVPAGR